ncbi:hypothetical protein [Gracilibacillus kekensis]|nr:hypothetical protein [Gracilibacillus kekensis]
MWQSLDDSLGNQHPGKRIGLEKKAYPGQGKGNKSNKNPGKDKGPK